MELSAPAKINLHLRVGSRRPDGFHPLLTWMTTVGLTDRLEFSETARSDASENKTIMTCDDPSLPCDGRNLVMKAVLSLGGGRHLAPAASAPGKGADAGAARSLRIHLKKHIPSGGGLGGGSSDAATTLLALNQFWNLGFELSKLSELAATLGSDVPFFLHGPSSICRGRGEAVRPIAIPEKARWVVLMLPDIMMPTAAVYRRFDEMGLGFDTQVEHQADWNQWCLLSSQDLLPLLINDLEPPAFALRPDLADLRSAIEKTTDRPVRMSGSGSSLFTLYDEHSDAAAAADFIAKRHHINASAIEMAPML
jgi:4-diphosphocytidyl-2-C-methyl-D-erythritol kinase